MVGKRAGRSPVVASAAGHKDSLLFAWDKHSRRRFLVDTGAEDSVLPGHTLIRKAPHSKQPMAAPMAAPLRHIVYIQ